MIAAAINPIFKKKKLFERCNASVVKQDIGDLFYQKEKFEG